LAAVSGATENHREHNIAPHLPARPIRTTKMATKFAHVCTSPLKAVSALHSLTFPFFPSLCVVSLHLPAVLLWCQLFYFVEQLRCSNSIISLLFNFGRQLIAADTQKVGFETKSLSYKQTVDPLNHMKAFTLNK